MHKFAVGVAVGLVAGERTATSVAVAVVLALLPWLGVGILHAGAWFDHLMWHEVEDQRNASGQHTQPT